MRLLAPKTAPISVTSLGLAACLGLVLSLGACAKKPSAAKTDDKQANAPSESEKAKDAEKEKEKKSKKNAELPDLPKDVMAKVGSVEIPMSAFRAIYDLKVAKYTETGRTMPKATDRRNRQSIAERLIAQEVYRQEAAALAIEVPDAEIQERVDRQKEGIRDWPRHLARRGESEESLREAALRELREEAMLRKSGKLDVTDEEIAAEYERSKASFHSDSPRIRASHILVQVGEGAPLPGTKQEPVDEAQQKEDEKAAVAKANEVYKLASAKGADFAALAKEYSVGPSARKGGDLGIFPAERMVKEFSDTAFKLKVGDVSKPVRTKFGYHIIHVVDKYPAGDLPLSALRDQINQRLETKKLLDGRRVLKEELLAKYDVDDFVLRSLGEEPPVKWGKKADPAAQAAAENVAPAAVADKKEEKAEVEKGEAAEDEKEDKAEADKH